MTDTPGEQPEIPASLLDMLAASIPDEPVSVPVEAFGEHVPAGPEGGECVKCSNDPRALVSVEWPCEYAHLAADAWTLRGMFEGIQVGMESPAMQIDRLASFIIEHVPDEPSRQDEGAVDCAIRLLGVYEDSLPHHLARVTEGGWTLQHPLSCRPRLFACPVNQTMEQTEGMWLLVPEDGTYPVRLVDGALVFGEAVA